MDVKVGTFHVPELLPRADADVIGIPEPLPRGSGYPTGSGIRRIAPVLTDVAAE
jgi:hypothetical protein